jgi:ketosteroid isomerase-like protein
MDKSTLLLKKTYYALNKRDIDNALATMHPDVSWANGVEGGFVRGHEQVRSYWTKQWAITNSGTEPLQITTDKDGHLIAEVRQVVRDCNENLISDEVVRHDYQLEDGLIKHMQIIRKNGHA